MFRNFNVISWNVRGLNEREKRFSVRKTFLLEKLLIICLQETKLHSYSNSLIKQICRYKLNDFLTIDAHSTRGGILTAWNNRFLRLDNAVATENALSTTFTFHADGTTFVLTNVYGPSVQSDRDFFLSQLYSHAPPSDTPWFLTGDFNMVLNPSDRNNGTCTNATTNLFRQFVHTFDLFDLPLQNRTFNWSNNRTLPTMARLDRFLVSHSFTAKFPNLRQHALPNTSSDHAPIQCTFSSQFLKGNTFRFDNYLLYLKEFVDFFLNFWFSTPAACTTVQFDQKIKALAGEITTWSKQRNLYNKQQLTFIRSFLLHCDETSEFRTLTRLERWVQALLKRRLVGLSSIEEQHWKQRSSIKWDLHGDLNSKFFHATASNRKRNNTISHINVGDATFTDHSDKVAALFDHFANLMGANDQCQNRPNCNLQLLYPTNLYQQNAMNNTYPISEEEVMETIKRWPNNRAPGPDGLTAKFFKFFMRELTPEITMTLNDALNKNDLSPLNNSLISLIPKKENPLTPADYRPISIVNSMQKLLSKILADRLAPNLNKLVTEPQTGFLKGRCITKNFLYAQTLIQHCHKSGIQLAVLKADLHKAFDTISLRFITDVLGALGFPQQWCHWITGCVLSGSSSILLNGLQGRKLILRRGVRQGDPLSPLLFVIAFDFLSRWLTRLVTMGLLVTPFIGVHPALFYADDSIIFLRPDQNQARCILTALQTFQQISGLAVNRAKSMVAYINTDPAQAQLISDLLQCQHSVRVMS